MKSKKDDQLGCNFCTASGKLKKQILFSLVRKLNLDTCFRCNRVIEDVEEFSIDHKIAWLDSSDPVNLFYDLDNITFSHLKCNVESRNKRKCHRKFKNSTGFKGVYYDSRFDKLCYRATLSVSINGKGKTFRLGRFETPEEAAKAYDLKAKEVFKNNAVLNFEDLGKVS